MISRGESSWTARPSVLHRDGDPTFSRFRGIGVLPGPHTALFVCICVQLSGNGTKPVIHISPSFKHMHEQDAAEDECSEMTHGQDSLSVPYGSYHQLYRIDGRLIAVGVVDVLPKCLVSVSDSRLPLNVRGQRRYKTVRVLECFGGVRRASLNRPFRLLFLQVSPPVGFSQWRCLLDDLCQVVSRRQRCGRGAVVPTFTCSLRGAK